MPALIALLQGLFDLWHEFILYTRNYAATPLAASCTTRRQP